MSHTRSRSARSLTGALIAALLLALLPGAVQAATGVVFDDLEDGDASDWGFFGGNAAGGGGGAAGDRPQEGAWYLSTGWGGEGTASGFYGGMFRNVEDDEQVTPPADPWFNVWVLNQSDATVDGYTMEITLREDTDANGWTNGAEDSVRLDTSFTSAQFNDQWTLLSAPLASFTDAGTGGNGTFDGALDEVVVVIAGVQGAAGSTVEVDFDAFTLTSGGPADGTGDVIDDFEDGLASGAEAGGAPLGFYTFQGAGSGIAIDTSTTPPAPVLDAIGTPNSVLRMDVDSTSFAGFIHAFENDAVDTWVPQDWSTREGMSLWFHGTGSGAGMFIDILDNRTAGSTRDDAERWTVAFTDEVAGWRLLEFPFASFTRKEIGNGAPNDGLGLFQMYGYAIGALGSNGPQTFFLDDVRLYGIAEPPALAAQLSVNTTVIDEGETGQVRVRLNRPMGPDDPDAVSIDFATERSAAVAGQEYTPTSGTLTFLNGGPSELSFPLETFDDTKFEGDEQIIVRLTDPVDVARGALFQGSVLIRDDDAYDPKLLDDFEQGAFMWDTTGPVQLDAVALSADDVAARPGQDAVENVLQVTTPAAPGARDLISEVVTDLVALADGASRTDGQQIDKAIAALQDADGRSAWRGTHTLMSGNGKAVFDDLRKATRELGKITGVRAAGARVAIDELVAAAAALPLLVIDVVGEDADAGGLATARSEMDRGRQELDRGRTEQAIHRYGRAWEAAVGSVADPGTLGLAEILHDFPIGQDWTGTESLDLWFDGTGSGAEITVALKDNRAPDPGPSAWDLVWSDEFDEPAGSPPNPANWGYEIGDVTPDGKNGWGNEELQYYTDDPGNAATDGDGNLVITLDEADPGRECYYGPCEYESARLITQHKAEFAYGRIESRLQVPDGGDGLWPAFWSLGADITYNPWPGAGEIDVMEYVSRLPDEIFGTIHGPGYNGGGSFSGIYDDFGGRVDADYHTFAIEWEPEVIRWYVDGIQYHEAAPSDVPGPWVFEKPYFLLLNFAIGGNFGGQVAEDLVLPQEFAVDYVRVYQGPDTAERFEATFVDDVDGWQQVSIPISEFVRSADQPAGAPDDGLGLTEVWGYGLDLPLAAAGTHQLDLVRRTPTPPPTELVVTSLADSGEGSLRRALATIADGGTITVDPGNAGDTLTLTTGPLRIDRSVTVEGEGLTISGGNSSRVLEVGAGVTAALLDLTIADGAGPGRGGGVLNEGSLQLERVVVRDNTETSAGPASFDRGGGGIYNGDGAVLVLTDSTVSDNRSQNHVGGGIYGFFNSELTITSSTISGNVGGDVAGGVRSLGDLTIVNSTISGNTSTAWHGGALFATDGTVVITSSTIVGNQAPAGTAGGLMVATFGAPVDVTLQNTIVADNGTYGCQVEGGGAAVLTSLGTNVVSDASCAAVDSDQVGPAGVESLADNGGPTRTHALQAGSPAIDAAAGAACPARDQRGVPRPQGGGCDVGAYERQ